MIFIFASCLSIVKVFFPSGLLKIFFIYLWFLKLDVDIPRCFLFILFGFYFFAVYSFWCSLNFIGRTDAEVETPIFSPPPAKSLLIGKDPDAGRDWGQEEKGTTEDEMVGWHHRLDGHEFGYTPGVGDGQGGLVCWDSWGCKESDMTERLNWAELKHLRSWFGVWH